MDFLSAIDLSAGKLALGFAITFAAGIVRGFAGFGMSAIIVLALSMVLPPVQIVPMALMMEVAASVRLLPSVRGRINWVLARRLFLGSLLGAPAGVYLLASVDEDAMRAGLSLFVLGVSLFLWSGRADGLRSNALNTTLTGIFSGFANGAASFGGQPVALFMAAASIAAAEARSTMIVLTFFTDSYASVLAAFQGLISPAIAGRAALFLVTMFVGIALGSGAFRRADQRSYRRFVLVLLMGLAAAGLVRTIAG